MKSASEQVAKLAGCSTATVSRVLNNSGAVSDTARQAVLQAIRKVGVMPRRRTRRVRNPLAESGVRSTKSTGLVEIVMNLHQPIERLTLHDGTIELGPIAVCPPDQFFCPENRYSNSHFRRIIDGAIDELGRWSLRPVIRATNNLKDRQLLSDIRSPDMQGLILLGMGGGGPVVSAFLRGVKCPAVSFSGSSQDCPTPTVESDDTPGVRQMVDHLVGLGHSRIGYIADNQNIASFRERYTAFRLFLTAAGLPVRPEWCFEGSDHICDAEAAAERMLTGADRPTAILCCYDGAALGVYRAARRLGLRIPEDLSIAGFGNQDIADLFQPSLTTVNVPTYEMGRAAVTLLVMQNTQQVPSPGLSARLRTSLVARSSTAPPAESK